MIRFQPTCNFCGSKRLFCQSFLKAFRFVYQTAIFNFETFLRKTYLVNTAREQKKTQTINKRSQWDFEWRNETVLKWISCIKQISIISFSNKKKIPKSATKVLSKHGNVYSWWSSGEAVANNLRPNKCKYCGGFSHMIDDKTFLYQKEWVRVVFLPWQPFAALRNIKKSKWKQRCETTRLMIIKKRTNGVCNLGHPKDMLW